MMDSLDFDVQPDEPLQSVSTYLKNKSAENVLKNVKNIIHNMKRYQVRHKDEKVEGDNAGFIIMREYAIDYYQRVAEFWVENPKLDIPEEMSNPQCYRLEEKEFNAALEKMELIYFDRFRFNPRVDNDLRRNKRYRDLYYYYHFNKKVREKGNEITEFKVTKEYIKLVRTMQDKMIAELACKGIGIETNPSSNYLIGTIKKYEEHPILRFNSRKLKDTNTGENLCVSINTDDQGVFDTLLENEYALMTLALKKATDDDMNALYDIEDIYEWIDYVRKMGINQVFS